MLTIQNAIGGRKVTSASTRASAVYNPATGEQIASLRYPRRRRSMLRLRWQRRARPRGGLRRR